MFNSWKLLQKQGDRRMGLLRFGNRNARQPPTSYG